MQKIKIFLACPLLIFALFSFGCIELVGTLSTVSTDPKLKWTTIETSHFKIHFHDGLQEDAEKVAQYSEEAHDLLTKELKSTPWGKIQVVVADISDRPNARAVQFPYPQMLILIARPGAGEALAAYDNWLRMIVIHEFTHIVHMDMAGGLWGALRYGLGRTILPNSVVPGWISEGYAVFQETDKGDFGRNRSSYVDMVLRMDILENNWPGIDQLNSTSGEWPYGARAYYHGGRFFDWIAKKYPNGVGNEKLGQYHQNYSSHVLNFVMLNPHASRTFGKNYSHLYREWQADLQKTYGEVKSRIESQGLVTGKRLTQDQELKTGLLYTPEGESLLYSQSSGDERTKFLKINTQKSQAPTVVKYDFAATDLTWDPEKKGFLYSASAPWRDYYNYSKLNYFDYTTKKISTVRFLGPPPKSSVQSSLNTRPRDSLAGSRRIFNPHLIKEKLIFMTREGSYENLWMAQYDDTGEHTWREKKVKLTQLTHADYGTEFNNPRWSPDGEKIAVSVFDPGTKQRDIHVFTSDGKRIRKLTDDKFHDENPLWSLDGNQIYFVSDRSGIFNIYVYDFKKQNSFQITNVLGGTFSPTLSPDGKKIAYLGYQAKGFDIYELELDPGTFQKSTLEAQNQDRNLREIIDPGNDEANVPENVAETNLDPNLGKSETGFYKFLDNENAAPATGKRYFPLPELLVPRFVSPIFQIIDDDDFYLGGTTGSTDGLRRHEWRLDAYYRTKIGEPGGSFGYTYGGWYPKLFLRASTSPVAQGGVLLVQHPFTGSVFGVNGRFDDLILVQRDSILRAGFSHDIPVARVPGMQWTPGKHSISGGYMFWQRKNESNISPLFVQFSNLLFPTPVFVPTEINASGFFLHYAYSSSLKRKRGISPTGEINQLKDFLSGYTLAIGYEFFNDALGGNWDQQVLTIDFRQYRRIPFTDHHVFALRGVGGFTFGEDSNPETFRVGGSFSEGTRNTTTRNFYPLRGFPGGTRIGEKMFLLSGEYRFPIWLPERGLGTLPIFLKNISGAFFADYGNAGDRFYLTNDRLNFERGVMGVGGELRTQATLFYNALIDFRIGYGIPILASQNSFFDFTDGELILNLGTTF